MYCYENKLTFPIYVSDQKFENSMNLLFVSYESLHYVPIYITYTSKILTDLQNKKQKQKILLQKLFQCFSSKNVLTEHKVCLSITVAQSVKLEKETIKFKNYFK